MLSEEVINKLAERLVVRIQSQNEEILKRIGDNIKLFKNISTTEANQLAQILKYGGSYNNILLKIQEITKLNLKEIQDIFEEVAKENYYFSEQFFKYRNIDFIPYEENTELKELVNTLAKTTMKTFINMSNTTAIGFIKTNIDGTREFVQLQKAYYDLIDNAVINVERGLTTFDQEMYKILKDYGQNGVNTINYESGSVRRLDSAIRMNMQSALANLTNEMQYSFGKTYGADGVEITVHSNPAPDHSEAQGKQFSILEFNKLQNGDVATSYDGEKITLNTGKFHRPITEYNCYHSILNIILGVSRPQYSKEKLEEIKKENNKGFIYEGTHYTNYEGTQIQRKLELNIRKAKDLQILAKASDNKKLVEYAQTRITNLTNKYKDFSKVSGLPTKMERMRVVSYKRTSVKN